MTETDTNAAHDELRRDPPTTARLLREVDTAWAELTGPTTSLPAGRLDAAGPVDGWSIKDHLAHLSAWERSLLGLLRGQSRWTAMGLDEATYTAGHDAANAALQQRSHPRPAADVLNELAATHAELRAHLATLTDADLLLPYSHYQPNDPPHNPNPVVGWIRGNASEHYREHLAWLKRDFGL